MTPTRSSAGSAPRTLRKPQAELRAAVKSSPTGPREARREAVPLDGRAQRSYPNHPLAHSPDDWVRKPGRSIKGSETPQHLRRLSSSRQWRTVDLPRCHQRQWAVAIPIPTSRPAVGWEVGQNQPDPGVAADDRP
jgi:hypothetical protein